MTDARTRDWERLQNLRDLPDPQNAQDLAAWNQGWRELLSELIESLQLSLEKQFPAETHRDDRENVLQDTLMEFYARTAWNYDPDRAGDAGLLGYLGTIAYRKMKKRLGTTSPVSENDVPLAIAVDRHSEQPLRELVFNDWFAWFESQLKEDEREIMRLRINAGLTLQEIANQVGRPLSTVHDILNRLCSRAATLERGEENG